MALGSPTGPAGCPAGHLRARPGSLDTWVGQGPNHTAPLPIVCNFMSHEKCLKHVKIPCTGMAPSLVRVRTERGPGMGQRGPQGRLLRQDPVVRPVAGWVGVVLCAASCIPALGAPPQGGSRASPPGGPHPFPPGPPSPACWPPSTCSNWVGPHAPPGTGLGQAASATGGLEKDQQGCHLQKGLRETVVGEGQRWCCPE